MKEILTQQKVDLLPTQNKRYKVWDERLNGFLVQIHPTGRKAYYCYLRINGRGTDYRIGSCAELTLKQARSLAAEALVKARSGISNIEEKRTKAADTLGGFIDTRYRDYAINTQKSASTTLYILESRFKEFLNVPLKDINIDKVEQWRVKNSKTLKPSTLNRRTLTLKAALNTAKRWGIITTNPLADLGLRKVSKPPVKFLSDQQLDKLREALRNRDNKMIEHRMNHNLWLKTRGRPLKPDYEELECAEADYLTPLATLIMESGLRFSEAINLHWQDIDSDSNTITVLSSKTDNHRIIPLHGGVSSTLRALKRLNKANIGRDIERIFVDSKGKSLQGVKTAWNGVRAELDFECDWRMLRRTFGSRLIRNKVPVYEVSQLLGHSSVKTTEDWYIGLDLDTKRRAMRTIDPF